MRATSPVARDLLETVQKGKGEIDPPMIKINSIRIPHSSNDSLALKRCTESLSNLQSYGGKTSPDSPMTMKVLPQKQLIDIKPNVEDEDVSSVTSQNHLPVHKSNNIGSPGRIRINSMKSTMTICSGITRNKDKDKVSKFKHGSTTSCKSTGGRILTKDLLESIEKTEIITTVARNSLGSGGSKRNEAPLKPVTPIIGLKESICSRRSITNSDMPKKDAASLVKIDDTTTWKGANP
jgi:hypothetical protein